MDIANDASTQANAQMGRVWLVGAGPGPADLITLRGATALGQADVVVYDALVDPALYRDLAAELIDVGKRPGQHAMAQHDIHALLVRLAGAGKRVVRLKGGDPFVFGRGGEEAEALAAAGIPCEVVPGVTAAIAAPAWAGIPVTHRDAADAFFVVSAHPRGPDVDLTLPDWQPRLTLVILMGVRTVARWQQALRRRGWPDATPIALVEAAGWPHGRRIDADLATVEAVARAHDLQSPAVAVIGAVGARATCRRLPSS